MKIETLLSRPEGKTLEFKSGTNINPDTLDVRVASGLFAGFRNWKGRSLLLVEVYPSALRPHWLKSQGIINGVLVRVGSTNRQTDEPLTAEMRRSALNISYDEEAMPVINPEALNFLVASGLFAGFREAIGKSTYDPQKRYVPAKESQP